MKTCIKCGFEGEDELFIKNRSICRPCERSRQKLYQKKFRENNKIKKKEISDRYRSKNKEKLKLKNDRERKENNDYYTKYRKEYYKLNRLDLLNKSKKDSEQLAEEYILKRLLTLYGINTQTARNHPELIESYKMQLKIKRELKNRRTNNDNQSEKTS